MGKKAMEKARREQEFELDELRRKSEIELEELKRKNEQTIVAEQGRRKRAELEYEQRLVKAKEELEIATIETEKEMSVRKMEALAALERKKVDMEKYRIQKISEADAERKRVAANIYYETETVNAEGDKQKMLGDAQAIAMDAGAEAEASKHLQHKRRHELEMREKDVLMKLALKGKFNLIGEPGDKIVNAVMTGNMEGGVSAAAGQSWFK